MPSPAAPETRVDATVEFTGVARGVAVEVLRRVGCAVREDAGQLISVSLAAADAGPALRLVSLLGHAVSLPAAGDALGGLDAAVFWPEGEAPSAAAARLRADPATAAAAASGSFWPFALILPALSPANAARLRWAGLPPGYSLAFAARAQSRYDLFTLDASAGASRAPLERAMQRLGLRPCPMTGAAVSDVGTAEFAFLERAVGPGRLIPLNRAFQRFDVVLAARTGLDRAEIADFLAGRTGLSAQDLRRATEAGRLVLDRRLPRDEAVRFQTDYAAIGIDTRAQLSRPASGG